MVLLFIKLALFAFRGLRILWVFWKLKFENLYNIRNKSESTVTVTYVFHRLSDLGMRLYALYSFGKMFLESIVRGKH